MARETLLSVVSPEAPDPICIRAAEIVRERWCQHQAGDTGQARCLAGALHEAAELDPFVESERYREAYLKVACIVGGGSPELWNDEPGRSAEEVADALERAARLSPPLRFLTARPWVDAA
jgi:hypothetical protein